MKGKPPLKAWEIFLSPFDWYFLWLLSHLRSQPLPGPGSALLSAGESWLSWWETDSRGRYREYPHTGLTAPHSQLFPKFKAGSQAPSLGILCRRCEDTSRHQAPVILTIHKNPCSLCSQWRVKTLWSWNVSDFIGHFSELLDTIYPVFLHVCKVTECWIQG